MKNLCYDYQRREHLCDECVFAVGDLTCANPNIWREAPKDAYFKHIGEPLTQEEYLSIERHV